MRLIAGPNGSGKTTLMRTLVKNKIPVGQYINPDDIARHIDLVEQLEKTRKEFVSSGQVTTDVDSDFSNYFAASAAQAVAIGLRKDWLSYKLSLTYESVMSHTSHLDFVEEAKAAGFEPYLYYICTSDPDINKARVQQRVESGGHNVPEEKIVTRYKNSLDLLLLMAKKCKRSYFFDNSSNEQVHFAEVTPDGYLDIFEKEFLRVNPEWFINNLLLKWDKKKIRIATL